MKLRFIITDDMDQVIMKGKSLRLHDLTVDGEQIVDNSDLTELKQLQAVPTRVCGRYEEAEW